VLNTHKYAIKQAKLLIGTLGDALRIFGICLLLSLCVGHAQATLILNDTFSDGSRTDQSLPNSADWVVGGPANNATVVNGMLNFADSSGKKATTMAYFNAVDLKVGESLTLSFNYNFAQVANADNSFMFGLYDAGTSFQTKDAVGFNNSIFNNYTGYAASGVFGANPAGAGLDHIEARTQTGHDLLDLSTYTEGNTFTQSGAATPGQTYTAWMQVSRTAAGVIVSSTIGNTSFSQTYSSGMFTQFNAVGIFSNGNIGSFNLDNVKLDYSSTPEPSSVFALMLLGVTVFGRLLTERIRRAFSQVLRVAA